MTTRFAIPEGGTNQAAVLVVGGSLVGLSAAMFLAARGVPTVLVERHRGSSPHPRAIGYTARTMELFYKVGLSVAQAPPSFRLRRTEVESLAGKWKESTDWTPGTPESASPPIEYTPYTGAALAQDRLEPMLRKQALELGAELRLGTELVSFEQDAEGVTTLLRERATEKTYSFRSSYLVAADGSRSNVREALGIGCEGRGLISVMRSVLFRAPLDEYLKSGISQFSIRQPDFSAFLTTYGDGRWVLMFDDDREREGAELTAAIEKAIGRTDLPIEIVTTGRWELAALITNQFSAARVFLAGDAAHTLPPTRGGFGANTGIHDVHNLAWKIAAVIAGESAPALLETYSAERRPVAWERLLQTFARPDYARVSNGIAEGVPILDEVAMELGQLYRSPSILGAGPELPPAARPDTWAGQPGTRAPHAWIERYGARRSTVDLLQDGWSLVTADPTWQSAGGDVPVKFLLVEGVIADAFGLAASGASLVRPDGYIAWRAVTAPHDRALALRASFAEASFSQTGERGK